MKRDFDGLASHSGFLSGRSISSYLGTWVLSNQDSSAAPQTVQIAPPYAAPRTSLQCVDTQRRNCIEQLSPSPEYAPPTVRFPARNPATFKLTHPPTAARAICTAGEPAASLRSAAAQLLFKSESYHFPAAPYSARGMALPIAYDRGANWIPGTLRATS